MTDRDKAKYYRELADATRQKQLDIIYKLVELNSELVYYKDQAEMYEKRCG